LHGRLIAREAYCTGGLLHGRLIAQEAYDRVLLVWADIGRIYIKGYLYPISYPREAKKDIPL
jgi:hypothetical protein